MSSEIVLVGNSHFVSRIKVALEKVGHSVLEATEAAFASADLIIVCGLLPDWLAQVPVRERPRAIAFPYLINTEGSRLMAEKMGFRVAPDQPTLIEPEILAAINPYLPK